MSDERAGVPAPDDESPWPLYFRPGPRRWPWVAAGLALVVVVGLAVVVGVALGGDSDGPEQARDPAAPTTSPTSSPSATPDPTPTPGTTLSPSASASTSAEPARFRCWDGTRVPRLADCTRPEGPEGLAYVYPSLAEQSCREPEDRPAEGLVLLVRCTDELADGTRVRVEYAAWETVDDAAARFDAEPDLTRSELSGGIVWGGEVDGLPTAVGLFVAEPFSLTVLAPTPEQLDEALETITSTRSPDQLRGEPIGDG